MSNPLFIHIMFANCPYCDFRIVGRLLYCSDFSFPFQKYKSYCVQCEKNITEKDIYKDAWWHKNKLELNK